MKLSWNLLISEIDAPHILQTTQWAEVKGEVGWIPYYLVWSGDGGEVDFQFYTEDVFDPVPVRAGALALKRQIFPGISVLYLPKGPLLTDWEDPLLRKKVIRDLEEFARTQRVIQIKIDPDVILGQGIPGEESDVENQIGLSFQDELIQAGWQISPEQIQYRNTVLVDLRESDEELLSRMKSKTRYNIRLSTRKGIQVRLGDVSDLRALYQMYANTSIRGGFAIRGEDYYLSLWKKFIEVEDHPGSDPMAQPFIAEYQGQRVAGAVIFKFGNRAWYLHGMSMPEHSDKMAPHLIQWEAMRWAKSHGCEVYDMWGAPDEFNESDSMWGVYRFKRGYGGTVVRTLGAWDYAPRKGLYQIYHKWVPRLLGLMRWFGKRRTNHGTVE